MTASLSCFVYRSEAKRGMYVYLTEKNNFEPIPADLRKRLGKLEYSFQFALTEDRKLVRYETKQVIQQIQDNGFFLQMPPPETNFLELDFGQSDGF